MPFSLGRCDHRIVDVRPPSFAEEYMGDWELWVLAHGLPDVPDLVAAGEAIPIARWVGKQWAAVLHLTCAPPEDEDPAGLDTESQAFFKSAGRDHKGPDAPRPVRRTRGPIVAEMVDAGATSVAITEAGEWTTRVLQDPARNEFCVIGPD
jgi:hypothetical protein